jgi:hypothetical protein
MSLYNKGVGMWDFKELDSPETRRFMLIEYERDKNNESFTYSTLFTDLGKREYPELLYPALQSGNEQTLVESLSNPEYWVNPHKDSIPKFGEGEFNVYYMRGLSARVLSEGGKHVEIYRAKQVGDPRHDQRVELRKQFTCEDVLEDLRNRIGGASKLGLANPNSGRSLKRV